MEMAPDRGLENTTMQCPGLTSQLSSLQMAMSPPESSNSKSTPATDTPSTTTTTPTTSQSPLPPHLSHDPSTNAKCTSPFQFGQRYLDPTANVFEYNAWDHVTPDENHLAYCEEQYERQRSTPVSEYDKSRFNNSPAKWWDLFYKQKTSTFFKDRKWLFQEFPILSSLTQPNAGKRVVLEVGAGAGNTAFPILRANENPELMVHAHDFSKKAVETMRAAPEYDEAHMRAEVWDVASTTSETQLPPGIPESSVDVVIMIFIFSALSPTQWSSCIANLHRVLKPGGQILFRDYGRGDLAQVRFKAGRYMEENFYVRGDGTRVYFFEKGELEGLWGGKGEILVGGKDVQGGEEHHSEEPEPESNESTSTSTTPHFKILNLDVDRRLIVNRQRKLTMYRCWIQGRFQKPGIPSLPTPLIP